MQTVVEMRGVEVAFRGRAVFKDLNWSMIRSESYGLVGPNGSGKSLLLRLASGLARPQRGAVEINEAYLDRGRTYPDNFGLLVDGPGYLPLLSGYENLARLADIRKRVGRRTVRSWMQRFDLDPDSRQRMRSYSLGMKQKIGIIQALMENPEVLLLDEPFNALDSHSVNVLNSLLNEHKSRGGTLVLTSHLDASLEPHARRILSIKDGVLRESVNEASR